MILVVIAKFAEVHATNPHGSLADVSDFVHFQCADQVISSSQATDNASGTIDLTFTDLAPALTYQISSTEHYYVQQTNIV